MTIRLSAATVVLALAGAVTPAAAAAAPADPAPSPDRPSTYRNPIIDLVGPADPAVIRYRDRYYLYPTLDGRGYDVFVSDDLVRWERHGKCFVDDRCGVWAPDVFHHADGDGRFYLYYTVNRPGGGKLIGVASADDPLGPFTDPVDLAEDVIDAHLFQDSDGSLYLFYVEIAGGWKIVGRPMRDPRTPAGEATVLLRPESEWEKRQGEIVEGPWVLRRGDTVYLMYSGSGANGPDYAIGYATAPSPLGPYRRHPGNPIAHRGNGVLGPGHHCVVRGPDDELWAVYHQKKTNRIGWDRFLAIDPLTIDGNGVLSLEPTRGIDRPAPVRPSTAGEPAPGGQPGQRR